MKTGAINNKNLGQGKRQGNPLCLFLCRLPQFTTTCPTLKLGEDMKRSWVERRDGKFCVMTGNITNLGFTDVKKTDKFDSLECANAKADLANYVWKKCQEVGVK